ncbi:MAG: LPS export ABC transporter periplasmic protein LptC [Gammaproteobacteria bacterium]|jgi:LPS export ABC transporter protein LptC
MNGWSRLILVMVGAVALIFSLSEPTIKTTLDPVLKEIADQRPDAFMEGVYQRQYDQSGQLETTLVATSLLDFGDRANAELVNPKLWLERPPATWYIEGDHGELTADRNRLRLTDNVIANRLEKGKDPWQLSSETLHWNQTTDLVTSKTTTTLVQGGLESVGDELVMNLNTNEYTLGDKVRTQWRSTTSSQ